MSRPPTLADMEFIEDEEPLEGDPHDEQTGGNPGDSSLYPDSSSHGDRYPETREEGTLESEPSSESPVSNHPSSVYTSGP